MWIINYRSINPKFPQYSGGRHYADEGAGRGGHHCRPLQEAHSSVCATAFCETQPQAIVRITRNGVGVRLVFIVI